MSIILGFCQKIHTFSLPTSIGDLRGPESVVIKSWLWCSILWLGLHRVSQRGAGACQTILSLQKFSLASILMEINVWVFLGLKNPPVPPDLMHKVPDITFVLARACKRLNRYNYINPFLLLGLEEGWKPWFLAQGHPPITVQGRSQHQLPPRHWSVKTGTNAPTNPG
jgi:hypothetical protein